MKFRFLASVVLIAFVASACGGESPLSGGDPEEIVAVHPLTGVEMPDGRPENPVFFVKIDNTAASAPQIGLDQADMVVEQLVEGGITRLAVGFYSTLPTQIGHVRSLRMTDIGIAKPVEAHVVASGGSHPSINRLNEADVVMHMEGRSVGFSSDKNGHRPYNVLVDLTKIADEVGSQPVSGNYFEFGEGIANLVAKPADSSASPEPSPSPLVQAASNIEVRYSPASLRKFGFADGTWSRTNGPKVTGGDFQADNLIVIKAKVEDAGYRDVSGAFVPETVFAGTGEAWIFQGGHYVKAIWSKADRASVLTFQTEDGQSIGVLPGKTWIALIPDDGGKVTIK